MLQVRRLSIQCLVCHMTLADESAITTHYDTARAPSRGRPRKSPLVCEVRGIKFADSSNKRRHLKGQCTAFYLQALCDVSVAIATKVYAKIDFAIFCGVQLGVQTLGRTHVRYA